MPTLTKVETINMDATKQLVLGEFRRAYPKIHYFDVKTFVGVLYEICNRKRLEIVDKEIEQFFNQLVADGIICNFALGCTGRLTANKPGRHEIIFKLVLPDEHDPHQYK